MEYPYIILLISWAVCVLVSLEGKSIGSPFFSKQANEIVSHLTEKERVREIRIGIVAGLAISGIFALGFLIGILFFESALKGMIFIGLAFPVIAIIFLITGYPLLLNYHKKRLTSTEWAKSQGIKPEHLQLFRWEKVK